MATIGASLKLFDQFSTTLNQAQQAMDKTIGVADRLKQKLQTKVSLDVDMSGAVSHIEQVESRMRSLGSGALKVVIDSNDVTRHIEQVRQNLAKSMIQIAIDPGDTVNQAAAIRKQVESQLTTITTQIESKIVLDLDANDIQKQVEAKLKSITTRTEVRITLDVEVQSVAEQLQNRLKSLGSKTMKVIIDSKDIMRGIEQIKQKLGQSVIRIVIDPGDTVSQAAAIRKQIESQLQGIKARIEIELPAKLQTSFQNIHNLVLRLVRLTRQLRIPSGGAGELQAALARIEELEKQIVSLQDKLNDKLRGGAREAGGLLQNIKGIAAAYLSLQALQAGIAASDTYISTKARIELINDGSQTTDQLQNNIFAAAERARGSFTVMASSIGKLGLLAGDAFGSNNELIAFAELMQKSFKVSGSSTMEQEAGMYQLTQAMAAGKLQGDEFRSIMENAPMLADAIAKFTGKTKGDLKDMSADGTITANIIKGALFSAANDINAKYATMPRTFGDIFTNVKNTAYRAFAPVIERISRLLNSAGGTAFINSLTNAIFLAAAVTNGFIEALIWIGNLFQYIWSSAQPFLFAFGAALALWTLTQIPVLIAQFNAMIVRLWLMLQPIIAQVVAWLTIYWPILLIGAAIGFLVYALYKWEDATAEVTGYVGGAFGILFGFLFNKFAYFGNIIMSVAEFFINVWKDPIYAVKKLFFDLVINALQYMGNLAKGIEDILNKIPGLKVNITGGLDKVLKKLEDARDNLKSDKDVVKLMRFEQIDYGEAFNKGQDIGKKVGHYAAEGVQSAIGAIGDLFDFSGKKSIEAEVTNIPDIGKVGELGKIKDTVDISNEDLRVMRELADMRSIQNFVTLTPTIQVTTGDIRETVDVDDVIHQIVEKTTNEIATSAQGVFG